MRQPISPTKKPLFPIEGKSPLGLFDRGFDGKRRGAIRGVVLQSRLKFLDLLLLPLGELLGFLAGGETGDVGDGGERSGEEDGGESQGSGEGLKRGRGVLTLILIWKGGAEDG